MAKVRTFTLPHYEQYPVHVCVFRDVTNAAFLRSQLLEANPEFDYAFLDASMILSQAHLLSASFLAIHTSLLNRGKTRTPHSELVFRLHANNNIGESYRKFGISDASTHLIAVKLSIPTAATPSSPAATAESVSAHLGQHVQGEAVEVREDGEQLGMFADLGKIRKVYKLDSDKKGKKAQMNGAVEAVDERKEMESVILGIITLKGS